VDAMDQTALEKNRDSLSRALQAMGLGTVLNPNATAREGVLVLAGTLFAEVVGAAVQAQTAAETPDEKNIGELAFAQEWATFFETLNGIRQPDNPISPRTQAALLAAFAELLGRIVDSYNPDDEPSPYLVASTAALGAASTTLSLATFGADDGEMVHAFTHGAYNYLADAHKALFYGSTHSGPYTEEH
jgi:hypothetical protein